MRRDDFHRFLSLGVAAQLIAAAATAGMVPVRDDLVIGIGGAGKPDARAIPILPGDPSLGAPKIDPASMFIAAKDPPPKVDPKLDPKKNKPPVEEATTGSPDTVGGAGSSLQPGKDHRGNTVVTVAPMLIPLSFTPPRPGPKAADIKAALVGGDPKFDSITMWGVLENLGNPGYERLDVIHEQLSVFVDGGVPRGATTANLPGLTPARKAELKPLLDKAAEQLKAKSPEARETLMAIAKAVGSDYAMMFAAATLTDVHAVVGNPAATPAQLLDARNKLAILVSDGSVKRFEAGIVGMIVVSPESQKALGDVKSMQVMLTGITADITPENKENVRLLLQSVVNTGNNALVRIEVLGPLAPATLTGVDPESGLKGRDLLVAAGGPWASMTGPNRLLPATLKATASQLEAAIKFLPDGPAKTRYSVALDAATKLIATDTTGANAAMLAILRPLTMEMVLPTGAEREKSGAQELFKAYAGVKVDDSLNTARSNIANFGDVLLYAHRCLPPGPRRDEIFKRLETAYGSLGATKVGGDFALTPADTRKPLERMAAYRQALTEFRAIMRELNPSSR